MLITSIAGPTIVRDLGARDTVQMAGRGLAQPWRADCPSAGRLGDIYGRVANDADAIGPLPAALSQSVRLRDHRH